MLPTRRRLVLLGCLIVLLSGVCPVGQARSILAQEPERAAGFQVSQASATSLQVEFFSPPLRLEEVAIDGRAYQRAILEGYPSSAAPGQPDLPRAGTLIQVPPGAVARVKVLETEAETLEGVRIPPAPAWEVDLSLDWVETPPQARPVYREDAASYGRDALLPDPIAALGEIAQLREQPVVPLSLFPLVYNPVSSQLVHYRYVKLLVAFEWPGQAKGPDESPAPDIDARREAKPLDAFEPLADLLAPPASANPVYRLQASADGMYRLTYTDTLAAGLPLAAIDPRSLRIYHEDYELAICVVGEQDGHFDAQDTILFYADAESNKYVSADTFWLTGGAGLGKRMSSSPGASLSASPVTTYRRDKVEERNLLYLSATGGPDELERWFWQVFYASGAPQTRTYNVSLADVAVGSYTATLEAFVSGYYYSYLDHHVRMSINGHLVTESSWIGSGQRSLVASFPQSYLVEGNNQVALNLPVDSTWGFDAIALDWFKISYVTPLQAQGSALYFGSEETGARDYQVGGLASTDVWAFDVTDPTQPVRIEGGLVEPGAPYRFTFGRTTTGPTRYAVLTPDACLSPASITLDTPSDLRNPANGADYIVITHADFMAQAQQLAAYRQASQGYRAMVVDVQDIYDEFNDGDIHPRAIHSFLQHAYESWQAPAPSFVVLLGDGTYDPKRYLATSPPTYIPPMLANVDPWLGEVAADEWLVMVSGDDLLPDMNLGRLPANSAAQAQIMVDKIIAYENSPAPGNWQKDLLFVSDNADSGGPFELFSDALITDYVQPPYAATTAYVRDLGGAGTRAAILSAINAGQLVVNFIGHGGVNFWTSERVLQTSDIAFMTNANKYPIVLPLTCSDGYFIHPTVPCLSESQVRAENKGAIASWAASGFGLITGHDYFNRGFLDAILHQGVRTAGEATMAGKIKLFTEADPGLHFHLESYIWLGDPALQLPNQLPVVGDVSPDAGGSTYGVKQLFAASYVDGNGWADIATADFLVNTSADPAGGVYLRYDQTENKLYLWDPAASAWIGGYAPGTAVTMSTASVAVDVAQCVVTGDRNILTVTWAVAFQQPLAGVTYNQYLRVSDAAVADSGWAQVGTWYVGYPATVVGLTPESPGARAFVPQFFDADYSNPDGWQAIAAADLLINHDVNPAYGVYLRYDQEDDLLYLADDLGAAWLGGYAPGSPNTIANGQVTVLVDQTSVIGAGTDLRVRWALRFHPWFVGWRRPEFMRVVDDWGVYSDWVQVGVFKVK